MEENVAEAAAVTAVIVNEPAVVTVTVVVVVVALLIVSTAIGTLVVGNFFRATAIVNSHDAHTRLN